MSHVEIISLDMNMQRNIQNPETRHHQELANRDRRPSLSIKSNWFLRQKPEAGILLRIPIPSFRSESAIVTLHWDFSVTSTPHCSCNDSCLNCSNVPYHPTRCQPEASLVVESAHGEESVVSERLLTRCTHLAGTTVAHHLGVFCIFTLSHKLETLILQ